MMCSGLDLGTREYEQSNACSEGTFIVRVEKFIQAFLYMYGPMRGWGMTRKFILLFRRQNLRRKCVRLFPRPVVKFWNLSTMRKQVSALNGSGAGFLVLHFTGTKLSKRMLR